MHASKRIAKLMEEARYTDAQAIIEAKLQHDPGCHWYLTQLGSCQYEQREYLTSLVTFKRSLEVVPDCPLTIWHLAGTLAALDDRTRALGLYLWILAQPDSKYRTDACWEGRAWTKSLKAETLERVAVCLKSLGHAHAAALLESPIGIIKG